MKKAFTLAEVLITLVVIGVIAALTIPTLMKANKRTETEAKLKKTYSVVANLIKLSQLDNDMPGTWDSSNEQTAYGTYIRPYLKFAKECTPASPCTRNLYAPKGGVVVNNWSATTGGYLSDGSLVVFSFQNPAKADMWVTFDVNGDKGPNQMAKDLFVFYYDVDALKLRGSASDMAEATAKSNCINGGDGNCTADCAEWLYMHSFNIPSDYPWL